MAKQKIETKKPKGKTTEWILFSVVTLLFGLSIFDRNPLTTMITGAGFIICLLALIYDKYTRG